jgi:hypothetical protein
LKPETLVNIFVLSKDPIKAAQMQCDKHVVKMVLESAQILSTVLHLQGHPHPYKPTHKNHPCVQWATEPANQYWLYRHFIALCAEYEHRYHRTHKCAYLLEELSPKTDGAVMKTPAHFVQCMPDEYKSKNVVTAYRSYYRGAKSAFARWTGRPVPFWMFRHVGEF